MPGSSPGMTLSVWHDSGDAAFKALTDFIFGQIAPDEHDAAVANLVRAPGPLMIAVEDHVDALKHETLGIVLERQDAFAAQNAWTIVGHKILDPGKKFVGVQRLVGAQSDRLHFLIVIVLETVAMMMVIGAMSVIAMSMIAMIVMMIVVMAFPFQKIGLDRQNAIKIEGVTAEHFTDVYLCAFRAMEPRIGIQPADARFQLPQFLRRHQIGLVQQDHVGKGDLVLGLGRVLQPVREPFGIGDSDNSVQSSFGAHSLIHEEGLR